MWGAVFYRRGGDAGGVRADGAQSLVFGAADCFGCGGGTSVADGREPDFVVGGTFGAFGVCGLDYCDHSIVVSGAGFDVVGASSHFVARQGRTGAGNCGTICVVLAGVAFGVGFGTTPVLGVTGADWWVVQLGF